MIRSDKGLIPFIMVGDPDKGATLEYMRALDPYSDAIELGVPFSDPVADGPTIQASMVRALESGTVPDDVFSVIREFRKGSQTPVVIMTYYNLVYSMGMELFIEKASTSGASALLVVDLPVEESSDMCGLCKRYGIDTVFLAAPNTPNSRLEKIDSLSTGYVYLVSHLGVTGAKKDLSCDATSFVQRARKVCKGTLAVGFGISCFEHARQLHAAGADAVVVGSAFIDIIKCEKNDAARHIGDLAREISTGVP